MSPEFTQRAAGQMTYPARGTLNRLLFKAPLLWWRMGLGFILWRWMVLITTRGRKSGLPRRTLLSYTIHGGKLYLISGWGEHADWYRNITADPRVTVQLGRKTYLAFARRVEDGAEFAAVMGIMLQTGGDSHFKPWLESLDISYDLDDLLAKRERVFLVALDPGGVEGPPPMPYDLVWSWVIMILAVVAILTWLILCAI